MKIIPQLYFIKWVKYAYNARAMIGLLEIETC
jgi:hypothetical protein